MAEPYVISGRNVILPQEEYDRLRKVQLRVEVNLRVLENPEFIDLLPKIYKDADAPTRATYLSLLHWLLEDMTPIESEEINRLSGQCREMAKIIHAIAMHEMSYPYCNQGFCAAWGGKE